MADPADIQRLIGDLAREGTVVSVDLYAGTCRVQFADDLTTGDIPLLAARVGKTRVWSPPSVDEQVANHAVPAIARFRAFVSRDAFEAGASFLWERLVSFGKPLGRSAIALDAGVHGASYDRLRIRNAHAVRRA